MKTKRFTQRDYIKAHRKASREAEIEQHTRPVGYNNVHKSKKVYDRNRTKAEQRKALPYLFFSRCVISFPLPRSSPDTPMPTPVLFIVPASVGRSLMARHTAFIAFYWVGHTKNSDQIKSKELLKIKTVY